MSFSVRSLVAWLFMGEEGGFWPKVQNHVHPVELNVQLFLIRVFSTDLVVNEVGEKHR